jgi:APA family basic amino acid/polyamine antiporter
VEYEWAAIVFFAYIGFDAVSTTAEETKNPQRDLPIGMMVSLFICTLLYVLMSGVLTGIKKYTIYLGDSAAWRRPLLPNLGRKLSLAPARWPG